MLDSSSRRTPHFGVIPAADFDFFLNSSYPHALHHLELLQHPQFRSQMKKDEFLREYLHQKQFDHWRTW